MYKNILFVLFFIMISCSEETILYDEIDNPEYTINTLTLPLDKEKAFQTQPSGLGTSTKLFFGNLKSDICESNNLLVISTSILPYSSTKSAGIS